MIFRTVFSGFRIKGIVVSGRKLEKGLGAVGGVNFRRCLCGYLSRYDSENITWPGRYESRLFLCQPLIPIVKSRVVSAWTRSRFIMRCLTTFAPAVKGRLLHGFALFLRCGVPLAAACLDRRLPEFSPVISFMNQKIRISKRWISVLKCGILKKCQEKVNKKFDSAQIRCIL